MIHGGVQGGHVGGARHFAAQQALSEHGWRIVVPDRPGHGGSPAVGQPDDAELDSIWAAEMLEDGAHLVGHSFGGCVALAAAARRPEAVRSLTLIEPAMQPLAIPHPAVLAFLMGLVATRLLPLTARGRVERFARLMRIPAGLGGGSTAEDYERLSASLSKVRVPSRATLETELSAVRASGIPLLVISGGWSPGIDATARTVAAVGGGEHAIIKSPHHFPQLASDEFNQTLALFMTNAEGLAGATPSRQ
jgi:pimeloyl-ACP methyl ester carboxylesterase